MRVSLDEIGIKESPPRERGRQILEDLAWAGWGITPA